MNLVMPGAMPGLPLADAQPDSIAALPRGEAVARVGKARANRGIIVSNCQVQPIKHIVSLLCEGICFEELAVHLIPAEKRSEIVAEFVANAKDAYDVVLSIPLSEHFGPISSARLKDSFAGRIVGVIPNFHFTGLHPDATYIGGLGGRYRGPIGDYHSKLAVYGFATGLSVEECSALFCDETYRRIGYYDEYADSLGEMARREQQVDIRFADELAMLLKEDLCFFTFNHPTSYLFWQYCRKLASWLEHTGVARTVDWPGTVSSLPNHLAHDANFPVYPEISTELGLAFGGSYSFKPPTVGNNAVNCIGLEEFVGEEYESFRKFTRDQFLRLSGVTDALQKLEPQLGLSGNPSNATSGRSEARIEDGFARKKPSTSDRLKRAPSAVLDAPPISARLRAAEAATAAKDWPRAAGLWEALRADSPGEARLWLKAGEACYEAGLFERADQILGDAIARFPDDRWIGYHHVLAAQRRRDWDEMLRRAERLRAACPEFWPAWIGSADALAQLGRKAEADARRRAAAARFPEEYWTRYGVARIDAEESDGEGAVRIWSQLVARFPGQPTAAQALEAAKQRLPRQTAYRWFDPAARSPSGEKQEVAAHAVSDAEYRCPFDLQLSDAPPRRVMVIGSCLSSAWPEVLQGRYPDCTAEHLLVNNAAQLPQRPPAEARDYDFHVLQIALRDVLQEDGYFSLPFDDAAGFERLFETVRERLSQALAEYMRWNREHGVLTFVCNFLVPQQNPLGRLLPRYDLRNFVYFVEMLNQALDEELRQYDNAYLFDFDQIVATYGRRHFQDDAVWTIAHGAALSDADWEADQARLEPLEKMSRYYPLATGEFVQHAWTELLAMYRTIRQADMVKLVLVDLDDTLWRGIAAEEAEASSMSREGWPFGFAEALMFLKKRGVLLGIVSKNDEDRVRGIWQRIYGNLIRLEDFAVRKINWQSKADNIEAILGEVNLLPKSVVFIDDNPVERAAIKAAFPDMRVLGPNPYLWRRILLWAPETQVAAITAESAARSEMVQKQVERESQRKRLSREEFLAMLEVRASLAEIASTADGRFTRTLELINKTNQFNTTGKRWSLPECAAFLRDGGRCFVLDVTDRFTAYGIVGVLLVRGNDITQFVMSCRVVGMDVEIATISGVLQAIAAGGAAEYRASLVPTSANLLCRDLWERCGFAAAGPEAYRRSADPPLAVPAHIALRLDLVPQAVQSAAD